jgi:GNAT superfamily N-acetyltransferase
LQTVLPSLAELRISVFRDYPYLYDGTPDYEARYLEKFAQAKDALIVAARDGDRIVGCATGSALAAHHEQFAAPFRAAGYAIDQFFYCGESVLLPDYRGHGVGHAFFDQRETHARQHGYRYSTFCAVVRPPDHPLRPPNYQPLDRFWEKRGYRKVDGLIATFPWKDIDQDKVTDHPMQFWMREL